MARLREAGWQVSLEPGVVDFLATTGYDAAYGARHLQRNIERELLAVLASSPSRGVVVELGAGRLGVRGRK